MFFFDFETGHRLERTIQPFTAAVVTEMAQPIKVAPTRFSDAIGWLCGITMRYTDYVYDSMYTQYIVQLSPVPRTMTLRCWLQKVP